MSSQLHLEGAVWRVVNKLNNNLGLLGYCIVGLFVLSWILSIAIYRWRRFDHLDLPC